MLSPDLCCTRAAGKGWLGVCSSLGTRTVTSCTAQWKVVRMDLSSLGKGIIALGVMLVVVGGRIWGLGKTDLPLGRLPGDIRIEGEKGSCYAPIVTMIILSVVLTLVLNIVVRLLNR